MIDTIATTDVTYKIANPFTGTLTDRFDYRMVTVSAADSPYARTWDTAGDLVLTIDGSDSSLLEFTVTPDVANQA